MALPPTETLALDMQRGWLTIWLNRPAKRNALSAQMIEELIAVFGAIEADRGVRGVTLRGRGSMFCAGGDVGDFAEAPSYESAFAANRRGGDLFAVVDCAPQVVVAAVEGAAIAGGLGLCCCADVCLVTNSAKFALTETRLGLAPAQIASYVAARIGMSHTRRLMLTGAMFNGADAAQLGIAHIACADSVGLDRALESVIHDVRACAPDANRETKRLLRSIAGAYHGAAEEAAAVFATLLLGAEAREGLDAFAQKRPPSWATS